MSKPKILVVEDDTYVQDVYRRKLTANFDLLQATTLNEGERLFQENRDEIVLVVMDACVPGGQPNSIPLVEEIRKSFDGPIIASSSDEDYRKILVHAGCSHEAPKYEVSKLIHQLFKIN